VRWRWVAVSVVWIAAACASHADDDSVDRAKCERLRDHLVDLRLAGLAHPQRSTTSHDTPPPPQLPSWGSGAKAPRVVVPDTTAAPLRDDEIKQHRVALQQAMGERFLASCQRTLSPPQLRCALAASDFAAATTCTSPSSNSTSSAN